jgi:hypothetical protein
VGKVWSLLKKAKTSRKIFLVKWVLRFTKSANTDSMHLGGTSCMQSASWKFYLDRKCFLAKLYKQYKYKQNFIIENNNTKRLSNIWEEKFEFPL